MFKFSSILFLCITLKTAMAIEANATQQENVRQQGIYVAQRQNDCINVYTIRLAVAASNYGYAYGQFDGARMAMVRSGTSTNNCAIEMGRWDHSGQLVERQKLKCIFSSPF